VLKKPSKKTGYNSKEDRMLTDFQKSPPAIEKNIKRVRKQGAPRRNASEIEEPRNQRTLDSMGECFLWYGSSLKRRKY
jgi:hypothetical protein